MAVKKITNFICDICGRSSLENKFLSIITVPSIIIDEKGAEKQFGQSNIDVCEDCKRYFYNAVFENFAKVKQQGKEIKVDTCEIASKKYYPFITDPMLLRNNDISNLDYLIFDYNDSNDVKKKIWLKAIQLQSICSEGNIYIVEDFIENINYGDIVDGYGYFMDYIGNIMKQLKVECNAEWIESHRGKYPYIIWFNKEYKR